MKVLIVSVSDKRHMPMIASYISYLEEKNVQYDIIRTNRYDQSPNYMDIYDHKHGKEYILNIVFDPAVKKIKKIIPFYKFRCFVKKIIKDDDYSFVIVWNENTAAVLSDILAKRFRYRYCVNIRDVYSHQKVIRRLVDHALKYASFITAPSPELETKFPDKTICVFNRDFELLNKWNKKVEKREAGKPIRITHLGFYSKAAKASKQLAELFGNDNRFELRFYGKGFDTVFRDFLAERGYVNIVTGGAFPYENTIKYLEETDIINSYYNRFEHPSLRISFGIKHSYTPMLHIPGLADENTCWGRLSKPYDLAFLVNSSNIENLPNLLYEWYTGIDFEKFCKNCNDFNIMIDNSIKELNSKMDDSLML